MKDWRQSFRTTTDAHLADMNDMIDRGVDRDKVCADGRVRRLCNMTRDQRVALARREAERDIQGAINRWNETH